MDSQQSDIGPSSGKGKKAKVHATSLMQVGLLTFALSALIVTASALLGYQQLAEYTEASQMAGERSQVDQQAARFGGIILGWQAMLAELARGPVREALLAGKRQRAEALLAEAMPLFPGVLRLTLIDPDQLNPDETADPPLSYACLDLVRLAEEGEQAPVELHQYPDAPAHIDFVQTVTADDSPEAAPRPLATLLLTLDQATLQGWLDSVFTGDGYIELRQSMGSGYATLATNGDSALKQSLSIHSREIPGTRWQLEVWRSDDSLRRELPTDGYYKVFAIAMGPLLLLFLLFVRILRRLLNEDMMRMMRLSIKVNHGEKHDFGGFHLREFASSSRALLDHFNDFPSTRGLDRNAMTERQAWEKEQEDNKKKKGKRLPGL